MKNVFILLTVLTFGFNVYAEVDGCKPCDADISKEQRQCVLQKYCKTKKIMVPVEKIVEKTVTVVEEKTVYTKNNLSLLFGIGPKGNIREERTLTGNSYHTDNGAIIGVQYSRNLDEELTGLIQLQSNRTFLMGVGVDF